MARYVQINSVPCLSTGSVMFRTQAERLALGDESWVMWGRGREAENEHEFKFGNRVNTIFDVVMTRLFGKPGFHSRMVTRSLIKKLDSIKPDVIHLHNIHGYYINIDLLFQWLIKSDCQVIWTLHDCWAFTGHCPHFVHIGCSQWKSGCDLEYPCPQSHMYPATYSRSSCSWSYAKKKEIFTSLSEDRITLIAPSAWLAKLTRESFLSKYPILVRHNTIDEQIYQPTYSDFRVSNNLVDKIIVLGVASAWSGKKGLQDFFKLREDLDDEFVIVLVGLDRSQIKKLPVGMIGIERTDSKRTLAAIYTSADLFFNPTYEDTYPTVNIESEACGTRVVSYDAGGSRESIHRIDSKVVQGYEEALKEIKNSSQKSNLV